MVERRRISSGLATEDEIGYSRALVVGNIVYVSATSGINHETMELADDVVEQARQAFINIGHYLEQAGATFADVARVRYIVPDPSDFRRCWPVLRHYFGAVKPAATMISCALADPRIRFEVEVTAHISGQLSGQ
jgi:enamine deaminase RidA (YjgF/YER057c/UK114 family)